MTSFWVTFDTCLTWNLLLFQATGNTTPLELRLTTEENARNRRDQK